MYGKLNRDFKEENIYAKMSVGRLKFGVFSIKMVHVTRNILCKRYLCASAKNTVDEEEVEKLSRPTSDWWDPNGEFTALHSMNKLRVCFVKRALEHLQSHNVTLSKPLNGFRILDVGCGGGILSEPLARLGADVTGVDASVRNIHAALKHASHDPLVAGRVTYKCVTVEELAEKEPEAYDCVIASEVIEHVTNKDTFISASSQLTKPGGSLVLTTINRTALSYAAAIVGAEYILRLVKPGTHDWNKFVTVEELSDLMSENGSEVAEVKGMSYLPVFNKWCWIRDTSVNYALRAIKPERAIISNATPEMQTRETDTG